MRNFGWLSKGDEMGWACGTSGGERKRFRFLVVKRAGKISHAKPRRRWEDNTEMDLTEMG